MISVDEAVSRVVALLQPIESETIAIDRAFGRVLADDALARMTQPPAPVSAMDGYAVHTADVAAPPATLPVVGSSPAGHPYEKPQARGEAVRIFTGGVVPHGADGIVIQEDAVAHGDFVTLNTTPNPGKHIRAAGLDFKEGDVLARAGRRLTARDVSLLAAADLASVSVRRKPRIAIAATGDELFRPGEARRPGGIVASSGYALRPMIENWGGETIDLGIFPDDADAIATIADKTADADLLVTLGGASVGDHDLIQKALAPRGFALDFWKIAMRPGKPLIFGHLGKTPLLGLPGNPVSTFVCAVLFLRPAIAALLRADMTTPLISAKLTHSLPANDARQDYMRAKLLLKGGEYWTDVFDLQDSSMLGTLARADALVFRAPYAPALGCGDRIDVMPLADL
ncbi:MAG TPA: gephyrin-like molybdotransferase Glp [Rhizomicrobium sp.]|nr:gephyrin-like molybdotransferase Glp [Rhizomicrobium sp.]